MLQRIVLFVFLPLALSTIAAAQNVNDLLKFRGHVATSREAGRPD